VTTIKSKKIKKKIKKKKKFKNLMGGKNDFSGIINFNFAK
jgi:hypothetical protein